ncbi:MAG: phosphoglucosamine mutase [Candidatus Omnitrophica bacterium]|nr:phosphoglucosamine mutase [Candidatus Omnitrophota bacterium]
MPKLFGTDGIRQKVGVYPLTEDMVYKLGLALGTYILHLNPHKRKRQKICITKDTRESGAMLESALAKGVTMAGVDVVQLGIMPSASLGHIIIENNYDLGIVISASHNAVSDNGLKFFSYKGYKLFAEEETEIEKILFEEIVPASQSGQPAVEAQPTGRIEAKDAKKEYIDFLKKILEGTDVSGYKIVIDCAYGSASLIAPDLFKEITKSPVCLNSTPEGENINSSCGALHPEVVSKSVIENKSDCGFSFDGDADRLIICDEKGRVLDGDFQLAIIGNYLLKNGLLRKNSIVATHMSNLGLDMCVAQWGGKLLKTEVGDKLVLEKMLSSKLNLGGEQSGHIIPLDFTTTGDGILTALLILKIMAAEKKPLSVLARCMYKFPQILVNVEVKNKKPVSEAPKLSKIIAKNEAKLGSSGRIYVRYSGTEGNKLRIMIEGQDQLQIKDMADAIAAVAMEELNAEAGN